MNTHSEITRILQAHEAREAAKHKDYQAQWEAYKTRIMERRLSEFEAGRLPDMCHCRNCIGGYLLRDQSRLCLNGSAQFEQATRNFRPSRTT